MRLRTVRTWALRFVLLSIVVVVLANQIHWEDRLDLKDGSVLRGRVEHTVAGDWRVTLPDAGDAPHIVPASSVAVRGAGEHQVPAVGWGLRTLGRRLAGHLGRLVGVLALLTTLIIVVAWRWRLLLQAVDLTLSFGRAVRLTFIGAFFNLAIPGSTGGDVVKAFYAARTTKRGTRAVMSVFVDRVVGLIGLAVFAAAVLFAMPRDEGYGPAMVVILSVLGVAVIGGAILASPGLRRGLGLSRIMERLPFQTLQAEVHAGLRLYRAHPLVLGIALGVSLMNHAMTALCVWLLAGALGIEGLEVAMALALVPVANLFSAIPVLPGGWGVGELAFAYLFGQVGIPPTEAVGLSIVYRLCFLAVSLPGGLLWLVWKDRPTKESIRRRVEEATHAVEVQEAGGI